MSSKFDPNAASSPDSGVFGLPYSYSESKLVYLPVPWEVTTSYRGGTSLGPAAVLQASRQVDLYDLEVERPYEAGLCILPESAEIAAWNEEGKPLAQEIIANPGDESPASLKALDRVNALSAKVNQAVYEQTRKLLADKKIPAILGGDHSVPLGAFRAASEVYPGLGILHFDAHSDTRVAFEGFKYSHASIMHNALEEIPGISKLVQVGIRDFCEQEVDYCKAQGHRVRLFFDQDLAKRRFAGETWTRTAQEIIAQLPREVWISFDIDGLDPKLSPNTGTPVPGGLEYTEAVHVIGEVLRSGRRIVGFDLNEVSPGPSWKLNDEDTWDAIVGARLLYKMSACTLASQGLAAKRSGP